MRKDMGKVITERPRVHAMPGKRKGYTKRINREGWENARKHEPMKARSPYTKEFTDVIGPLQRYVKKQIGRPWSKVLSEVSQALPSGGGMSYDHARRHFFDFVSTEVTHFSANKEPLNARGEIVYADTYVCPKSGLLKKNKFSRHAGFGYAWDRVVAQTKHLAVTTDDKYLQYHRLDGTWYALKLARLPIAKLPRRERSTDLFIKAFLRWWNGSSVSYATQTCDLFPLYYQRDGRLQYNDTSKRFYGGKGDLYCKEMRQASKQEIRQYITKERLPQPVVKKKKR